MIAKLTGLLDSTGPGWCVIDVGGVGYQVFCSSRTLETLGAVGKTVELRIKTQLRDESIRLFGFADPAEREVFRLLETVQGVGAKVALALLGVLTPDAMAHAIASEDRAALSQASGVGPRLAGRIIAELKDKLGALPGAPVPEGAPGARDASNRTDAASALMNLGYRPSEAHSAVAAAARSLGKEAPVPELVREGLKGLSQ
ncbi:MAG: Holliday junction branch migration protein RuvA [Alphaproteobacteria bacterium]